jgi:hypothetical protein
MRDTSDCNTYFDPLRGRLVKFPAHWPPTARRYFLNCIGEFLAEQAIERAERRENRSDMGAPSISSGTGGA